MTPATARYVLSVRCRHPAANFEVTSTHQVDGSYQDACRVARRLRGSASPGWKWTVRITKTGK